MKKVLLTGTAVAGLTLVKTALAADLPIKAPPPMVAPAFTWTGCYIGGHAGGAWEQKRFRASPVGPLFNQFTILGVPQFVDSLPAVVVPSALTPDVTANLNAANAALINTGAFDQNLSGPLAGGQIGCNLQFAGGWVIGVEGDASWAGLGGTKSGEFTSTQDVFLFGPQGGALGFSSPGQ